MYHFYMPLEDKRLQKFEELEMNGEVSDAIAFSLLRDFEYTNLNDDSQLGFFSDNSKCFVTDDIGKYSLSQYAKTIRSQLIKIFLDRANKIFTRGHIDKIDGSLLPIFIFLCSRFLKSINEKDLIIGLRQIEKHDTLQCLFEEGESITSKYPCSVKQAVLNNTFFIADLLMYPEKYHSLNLDFGKEEIKNALLRCKICMEDRQSLSLKEEFSDPNLLTESSTFINFLHMIKDAGEKWKVQFKNCWFQYNDIPRDIKTLNIDHILPKAAIICHSRIEVQMPCINLGPEIDRIISGERNKKKKLLALLFLHLPLCDSKGRALFLPEGCPFYGNKIHLQFEYTAVLEWYRNLKKYRGYSLEKLIEYFYNVYITRQINDLSFHLKMSSSRNWVEKLRNNFQEEEIIFDTCQTWYKSKAGNPSVQGNEPQFLYDRELEFRDYLLNDRRDTTNRIPKNEALRNIYIHKPIVYTYSNETHESNYVALLHFMIFEMEKLKLLQF